MVAPNPVPVSLSRNAYPTPSKNRLIGIAPFLFAGGGNKWDLLMAAAGRPRGERAQLDIQPADADALIWWLLPIRGADAAPVVASPKSTVTASTPEQTQKKDTTPAAAKVTSATTSTRITPSTTEDVISKAMKASSFLLPELLLP
ncbi:hypothetical protein KSW81_007837 [Nannochloris sp. 'desiccata']|nr:hypothetical protein KSW81_007837 [Chlorella desiccata (nom. nud.)]